MSNDGQPGISHGICTKCAEKLEHDYKKAEDRFKENTKDYPLPEIKPILISVRKLNMEGLK